MDRTGERNATNAEETVTKQLTTQQSQGRAMLCWDLGVKGKGSKHDLGKGKSEALRRVLEKLRSGAESSKSNNVKEALYQETSYINLLEKSRQTSLL